MAKRRIVRALEEVGEELRADVEILVLGGGAGVLTGELPETWTTSDVDAIEFEPSEEVEEVLRAAAEVGRRLELPANWLNVEAGLYGQDLPRDWKKRRVLVGKWGKLRVWAVGRLDLLAMKFYAHRPIDRQHLAAMKVTQKELQFVRAYLRGRAKHDAGKAAMARAYIDAWEVHQ